jgi:acyl-coenzyme A thioesterase 9
MTIGVSDLGGTITASSGNKIFNVKPATLWIDKLAQEHGSPTSTVIPANESNKSYKKRELVLRSMQDSYIEIILPFSKDKGLQEEYVNFSGNIR